MSSFKASWKNYLLSNPEFEKSNNHLPKILALSDPIEPFESVFEEISKNHGISLISFDPSESEIQLFHHNQIIGRSWDNPKKYFTSIRGSDNSARPVQIVLKSIKVVKTKTPALAEKMESENMDNPLEKIDDSKKSKKIDYFQRNILPIPHVLTKAFLNSSKFDPLSVAQAFYTAMLEFDQSLETKKNGTDDDGELMEKEDDNNNDLIDDSAQIREGDESSKLSQVPGVFDDQDNMKEVDNEDEDTMDRTKTHLPIQSLRSSFLHILQFCYLCSKQKIPPVHYSIVSNPEIDSWFNKLDFIRCAQEKTGSKKRNPVLITSPDSESSAMSPDPKISRKDQYFIHTMLKIHDTMDKNYKEKTDKEPGFLRLEDHRKNLILNASALPPYNRKAPKATEFYSTFLAKKSQFKAKDMLLHQLHSEKIAFIPSSGFVNNLWNCEFFWLLPDSPSGVSIFFCPETKSSNASDIEKERMLALADKVNVSDIEKLTKQKLYLPNNVMDLVWMTQNLHAVIKLCFGSSSHSAVFLKSWADHMYGNRIMYTTLFNSDPYFFGKVLYAIDNALQVHWRSCSANEDRLSVNDRVLLMEDVQESILGFSFARNIPKSISDKIQAYLENKEKEYSGKNGDGKIGGGGNGKIKFKGQGKQEVVHNNDKSHPNWRLKDGENFSKIFYHRQKDCPKTSDGKLVCMKFLIRGLCDSTCTRAHTLSKEDSKHFDDFVSWCRIGGQKPDF
jgi:hypothetical protein